MPPTTQRRVAQRQQQQQSSQPSEAASAAGAAARSKPRSSPAAAPTPHPPPIDESGPLVFAVGKLGPAYWDWLDRPVPGRPRFFAADWLEACSKTAWWVVPLIWLPVAAALSVAALRALAQDYAAAAALGAGFGGSGRDSSSLYQQQQQQQQRHAFRSPAMGAAGASAAQLWRAAPQLLALQLAGVALWQLLEYSIHRFAFHARGESYWAITVHFLFHGNHHKYPMDGMRLVFPPIPAAAIASIIYMGIRMLLPRARALAVMSGVLLGYTCYDCMHYALHHGGKLRGGYLRDLRQRHAHHHYQDGDHGFQISSPLFDVVFGTRADLMKGRRGGKHGSTVAVGVREDGMGCGGRDE